MQKLTVEVPTDGANCAGLNLETQKEPLNAGLNTKKGWCWWLTLAKHQWERESTHRKHHIDVVQPIMPTSMGRRVFYYLYGENTQQYHNRPLQNDNLGGRSPHSFFLFLFSFLFLLFFSLFSALSWPPLLLFFLSFILLLLSSWLKWACYDGPKWACGCIGPAAIFFSITKPKLLAFSLSSLPFPIFPWFQMQCQWNFGQHNVRRRLREHTHILIQLLKRNRSNNRKDERFKVFEVRPS